MPSPGRHRDLPAVLAPAGGRRRSGLVPARAARREVAALLLSNLCSPDVHPAEERGNTGSGRREDHLVPEAFCAGHRLLQRPGRDLGLLQRLYPRFSPGGDRAGVPDTGQRDPEYHRQDADEAPRVLAVEGALLGLRLRSPVIPAVQRQPGRPVPPDRELRPVLPLP